MYEVPLLDSGRRLSRASLPARLDAQPPSGSRVGTPRPDVRYPAGTALVLQAHSVSSTCKTQGEEAGSGLEPISLFSHVGTLQPVIEELVTAVSGTGTSKAHIRGGYVTLPCY